MILRRFYVTENMNGMYPEIVIILCLRSQNQWQLQRRGQKLIECSRPTYLLENQRRDTDKRVDRYICKSSLTRRNRRAFLHLCFPHSIRMPFQSHGLCDKAPLVSCLLDSAKRVRSSI
jgi:hypothetical protein